MCLDDPGGSLTAGTQLDIAACTGAARQDWGSQQFTYTPQGQVRTVTTSAGTSTYTYDASGNLLLQADPVSTTLYLDGGTEELTLTGSNVVARRYYPSPDGILTVRTYNPSGNPKTTIGYEVSDPQHTATEYVDAASLALTRRYYDPYGNPVGTVPSAWPDGHAYLGKPADPVTGYDLLGARQYNPPPADSSPSTPSSRPATPSRWAATATPPTTRVPPPTPLVWSALPTAAAATRPSPAAPVARASRAPPPRRRSTWAATMSSLRRHELP
jgi:YD repeat-containing protein